MKIYDLLWKRTDGNEKSGKVFWQKIGILMEKENKLSVKIDLLPAGNWDGWLTVSERKE
ncbi:MAG: hypothetical protein ACOYVJ_11320 [Nitrospirota bacterium]